MSERIIRDTGIAIATEAFGNPAHPPILLIMGGGASMLTVAAMAAPSRER